MLIRKKIVKEDRITPIPQFIFKFFWFRMLWLMVSCFNLALICKIRDVRIRFCLILSRYEFNFVLFFPKILPFLMASGASTLTNWNATHLDPDRLRPAFVDERIGTQFHTSTRDQVTMRWGVMECFLVDRRRGERKSKRKGNKWVRMTYEPVQIYIFSAFFHFFGTK